MPQSSKTQDYMGYTPTSLDFINRPNPVEPTAAPPKHPLHGPSQLSANYTHELRRLLLDAGPRESSGEASAKRRKAEDEGSGSSSGKARDLPKLPPRPTGSERVRRTRLPPTLSGLHQPPPNAGILPSISVEQPISDLKAVIPDGDDRGRATVESVNAASVHKDPESSKGSKALSKPAKPKRNKWSDEETAFLLRGVARFGIGSWTKILKCDDYQFQRRTALDLKDRFRVCCPEHYKKSKPRPNSGSAQPSETQAIRHTKAGSRRSDQKDTSDLAQLGIEEPFQRSARRSRHEWTEDEDESLLKGFQQHGKSWASIQQDSSLSLAHRKPTDLRDRFRQHYPDQYAKVGLVPRPVTFPPPPDRVSREEAIEKTAMSNVVKKTAVTAIGQDATRRPEVQQPKQSQDTLIESRPKHAPPMFLPNDVFFGIPAEDENFDTEPIVLDRGILDWALDSTKPTSHDMIKDYGDPVLSSKASLVAGSSFSATAATNNASASLPSLAAITASNDNYDDLELPSLMHYINALENDNRSNGHGFLSLEDLLSQS